MEKSNSEKIFNCELCGQPLPPQTGKGRPRKFHDNCRKLSTVMSWAEDLFDDMDFTPERAAIVRRQLWAMGNKVKAKGQKGVR